MKSCHFSLLVLLLAALTFTQGCSGNPAEPKAAQEAPPAAPAPETAPIPNRQPTAETPAAAAEQPAKPAEHVAPKPRPAPIITENPEGRSTGYISRDNVVLQSGPSANAPQVRNFKRYEGVIILETRMTDEHGQASDIPVWYKVQCVDKKTGWVEARSVTMN